MTEITEHEIGSEGHRTFFLAAGPEDGPLVIFIHGWPELSLSWRHVLPCFGALGFRAVAPDMRGYGRSTTYTTQDAYAQEKVVADMLALLAALGRDRALWVGHDWGAPTVWALASHHPDKVQAVVGLSVPYWTIERGVRAILPLVDRKLYPEERYPYGQWEYQRFYEEHFDRATAVMDANPRNSIKLLLRGDSGGSPDVPSPLADIYEVGGWFNGLDEAPDVPFDDTIITEQELSVYAHYLEQNTFFGPNSYYVNHEANAEYSTRSVNDAYLDMPVLFVAGRYDSVCDVVNAPLAKPMEERCRDLTSVVLDCGHWIAQERPAELNAAIVRWIVERVPTMWPR